MTDANPPLRSALKNREASRPASPSQAPTPASLLTSERSASPLDDDRFFKRKLHSPTLVSRVPLPPSPTASGSQSLPPTPGEPQISLPPLTHAETNPPAHRPPPIDSGLLSASSSLTGIPSAATTIMPNTPYTPKVSFDTFENPQASMFSFTLQVKHAGYKRTRNTRVYLCAASPDESGQQALEWALDTLAQDGDEVIVFRGLDEEVMEKDHNILRENARELMKSIQEESVEADPNRKLSLILEYIPGKVTDSLDRLIALYRPDSLVVGTRGRRGIMAINMGGIGSISKYCLSHSPVPVIVVRPERKLRKAVEKRKADPKRGRHFET
ncbi:hypothetical protein FA15DRAFT_678482 [Coprinopsis marcescibilis]|uniref:UspA domain-containing protein n=1 Tax=Coprinopsis marcescibilis TaxID=230819 RepID=A0A5C3L6A2_COPMA|nr:hypothetical protein FA15DRAFT_678482 [Coprinopsis marcescibilis]